jgi:hypothetical protein
MIRWRKVDGDNIQIVDRIDRIATLITDCHTTAGLKVVSSVMANHPHIERITEMATQPSVILYC